MNAPAVQAMIYHLANQADWDAVRDEGPVGRYRGGAQDLRDGFIHFSTGEQIAESASRHRAGETDLVLLEVDPDALGDALRWEASRGGALFPHLHGALAVSSVRSARPLPLGADGRHIFPDPID